MGLMVYQQPVRITPKQFTWAYLILLSSTHNVLLTTRFSLIDANSRGIKHWPTMVTYKSPEVRAGSLIKQALQFMGRQIQWKDCEWLLRLIQISLTLQRTTNEIRYSLAKTWQHSWSRTNHWKWSVFPWGRYWDSFRSWGRPFSPNFSIKTFQPVCRLLSLQSKCLLP